MNDPKDTAVNRSDKFVWKPGDIQHEGYETPPDLDEADEAALDKAWADLRDTVKPIDQPQEMTEDPPR